jgi:hypothetical protein
MLDIYDPCIIGLTETWLDANIFDYELQHEGFKFYRKDRCGRGGGLLLCIKDKYSSCRRSDLEINNIVFNEIMVVEVVLGNFTFMTVLCYRPPNADNNFNTHFADVLNNISRAGYKNILCMGDMNLPDIDWLSNTGDNKLNTNFTDICFEYDLCQLNRQPSRANSSNILDVVLTNFSDKFSEVIAYPSLLKSDHFMLETSFTINGKSLSKGKPMVPRYVDQFKDTNFDQLEYNLYNVNLEEIVLNCRYQSSLVVMEIQCCKGS